ncbi:hypothetical protein [Paraburkholderia sp. SIMBA_030]|uniref:hypothetical protein n=1 Tax=Paraburkholderia sp. SIMBA_030 TaxID=3085773 RepID=UPI003979550D
MRKLDDGNALFSCQQRNAAPSTRLPLSIYACENGELSGGLNTVVQAVSGRSAVGVFRMRGA